MAQRFVPITIQVGIKGDQDVRKLTNAFKDVKVSAESVGQARIGNPFDQVRSQWSGQVGVLKNDLDLLKNKTVQYSQANVGLGTSIAGLINPYTLLAAAIPIVTGLMSAAVVKVFDLAKATAEYDGNLHDLSQKTNFTTQTLSLLSIEVEKNGGTINSIVPSLTIFQSNMVKAANGNKALSKTFKDLNIDTIDQEKAFRQAAAALFKMGETEQQSAKAKQLFGVNAKEVLGVIKSTNGNIDEAIKHYSKFGRIVTDEAARAADQFNDDLKDLEGSLTGVTHLMARETLPAFTAFFQTIQAALEANKTDWKSWGQFVANTILTVEVTLGGFANLVKNLDWTNFLPIYGPIKGARDFTQGLDATAEQLIKNYNLLVNPPVGGNAAVSLGRRDSDSPAVRAIRRGSDPAAAARRIEELKLKATLDSIKAEEDALERSYKQRQLFIHEYVNHAKALENDRHESVVGALLREQEAVLQLRDVNARNIALQQLETRSIEEQNKFRENEIRLSEKILAQTRERIVLVETLIQRQTRPRRVDDYFADVRRDEKAVEYREKHFADEDIATFRAIVAERKNLELDLAHFRAQAADDQFAAQRRLMLAEREEIDLLREVRDVQDEIANGQYNQSLRIQLALLHDIADIRRRDEDAIKDQNRAQLELADAEIFHGEQARAIVLRNLSQTRTQTEVFADAIVDAYDAVNDVVLKGVQRITGGIRGLDNLIAGLISRLTNKLFQKLLDVLIPSGSPSAGGTGPSGSGGISGFLRGLFGGGGGTGSLSLPVLTGGFAGGPGAGQFLGGAGSVNGGGFSFANLISNPFASFAGGGITPPESLTSQLAQQSALSGALQQSGVSGLGNTAATGSGLAGLFSSSGLVQSLGPLAPLLGAALGSRLGGSSRTGSILGGIGGGLAGLGLGAGLSFAAGGGAFGASIYGGLVGIPGLSGLSALFGGLGGAGSLGAFLSVAGPLAVIAAPLIIGAIILARNAARRRDEKTRNQAMLDHLGQLNEILRAVKSDRMDGGSAIASASQIRAAYIEQMSALKDSKTRRIALADVSRLDAVIAQIRGEADLQLRRQEIDRKLVPEFATGAVFKSDYFVPRAARGLMSIPGAFDKRDDVLMRVSRGEHVAVMTPQQYNQIGGRAAFEAAGVPAFGFGTIAPSIGTFNPYAGSFAASVSSFNPRAPEPFSVFAPTNSSAINRRPHIRPAGAPALSAINSSSRADGPITVDVYLTLNNSLAVDQETATGILRKAARSSDGREIFVNVHTEATMLGKGD